MATSLNSLLHNYHSQFPEEQAFKARFYALLDEPYCFERKNLKGHFTASCWVTDPVKKQVLLLRHAKLNRWLQPGGHADGNTDLLMVAMKELQEETGISNPLKVSPEIFDLDIHAIPQRKTVPEHEHFDVRFHFIADSGISLKINEESTALQWVPLDKVAQITNYERSFERMVYKTKF